MIDTHVHHFDLQRFAYPWLEDSQFVPLRADYGPDDYLADVMDAPVSAWVHVQAEVDHAIDPVAETAWLGSLSSAGSRSGPAVCVGYADLAASDVEDVLERHCRYPILRGIRQELWFDPASERADIPPHNLLDNPAWRRGFRSLARFGLSFDLLVLPSQLREAALLLASTPEIPVAVEHMGLPGLSDAQSMPVWEEGMRALAKLPNTTVKLSALSQLGTPRSPARARRVLEPLLAMFGPERCMFGSNFPVERLAGDFGEMLDVLTTALGPLSASELAQVAGGTGASFYRISL